MSRAAVRRRRSLFGFLAGLIAGGFATPPMPLVPVTGDLVWLLLFAIPAALVGFAFPVDDPPGKPARDPDG